MKYFELEILVDWYRKDETRAISDRNRRDFIEVGSQLGMRNLKIGASHLDEATPNLELVAEEFGRLCDDVAQVGANVSLEFMPFSSISTLQQARTIVESANRPNGGLMLDIWHVARSGAPFSDIESIPARFITGVELDDANTQVVGTLFEDTRFQRQLCGEGDLDCPAFIDSIQKAGFAVPYYGVELISETFRKLPLEEMATRAYETTMAQFTTTASV